MYSYICKYCETETMDLTFAKFGETINLECDTCGNPEVMRTVGNFTTHLSMPEHFNQSTGKFVTNSQSFKSQLSQKSDEMSERMNMTVKYGEVDGRDAKALGVTSEGMESTIAQEANPLKRRSLEKALN